MAEVPVNLPHHRYVVTIEPGVLDRLGSLVRAVAPHARCALIADAAVGDLYGERGRRSLAEAGYAVTYDTIEGGERHKSLETVRGLYDRLLADRLERRSPVVALGGGIAGDTVGFAAATYLRGVPFVQAPTTLLAMVDASVGGKVGVNVPQGKNLIGAFHQPHAVLIDPLTLTTLPPRELRCGLAECVKHGMIRDASLLAFIETKLAEIQALEPDTLVELLRRNVAIKAAVVMEDEKESGVRAHLNFGHTFAHAIEAMTGYGSIEHGEAVSLGMVAATTLAVELGMCEAALLARLRTLLDAIGLPTDAALPETDRLLEAMTLDKKVSGDRVRFVLPEGVERVTVRDDVTPEAVREAWEAVRR